MFRPKKNKSSPCFFYRSEIRCVIFPFEEKEKTEGKRKINLTSIHIRHLVNEPCMAYGAVLFSFLQSWELVPPNHVSPGDLRPAA